MLKTMLRSLSPTEDAISLLKEDHRKVEGLFEEFEAAGDRRVQGSVAQRICAELELHAKIEESIFYPTAKREAKEAEDAVNEGIVEHEGIKRLVREIQQMKPGDEMFEARVQVLMEYVKHHVREEENEMFPKITESDIDLKALGERLSEAKERHASDEGGRKPARKARAPRKQAARRTASRSRARSSARGGRSRGHRGHQGGAHAGA